MRFATDTTLLVILGILLLAGAVLILATNVASPAAPSTSVSPIISASPTSTAAPTATLFPDGISDLIPECALSGVIEYVTSDRIFRHRDAWLRYEKVGDPHDVITWRVAPSGEEITIGPNRFSQLPLPNGKETLTINFPNPPQKESYRLSASIEYPYFVDLPDGKAGGEVQVLKKSCAGSIQLQIQ